ncbi:hypothetical protein A6A03_02635 [Chloroflexus islandicus]|uniref:Uncharacterized protein n=1 Tax=Chloroflexus islandicus TaxID=1707952 RepID=A0A178M8H7_9CHLR|nr:hypothetical protein [Chloroflexus islandicus]OAN45070.1 hypothetical protein A6A03_02635 [Chloroflexus islandicus]
MLARIALSLLLGFICGTTGLVFMPDLARVIGPFICTGELQPVRSDGVLHFRCRTVNGDEQRLDLKQMLPYAIISTSLLLIPPVHTAIRHFERRYSAIRQAIDRDLATSVPVRAELLKVEIVGSYKRAILMRAVETELTLWVYPPAQRPYEARAYWLVEEAGLPNLRRGTMLNARINPLRPQRVYPAEPWATYLWHEQAPAGK